MMINLCFSYYNIGPSEHVFVFTATPTGHMTRYGIQKHGVVIWQFIFRNIPRLFSSEPAIVCDL